jgi:hypothetical protein
MMSGPNQYPSSCHMDNGGFSQQRSHCLGYPNPWDTKTARPYATKEELDRFIAQSIATLSFQDRQRELEELHGVSKQNPEDPKSIEEWLQQLDTHLNTIKQGTSYELAESMNRAYVVNRDFRLMFLRADGYDPKAAAERMIRFFDMKGDLFGREKLVKDIMFSDLDEDDRAMLRTGAVQVLDRRDTTGRQITVSLSGLRKFKVVQNELRARYYLYMSSLASQRTQVRGYTAIIYAVGRYRDKTPGSSFLEIGKLVHSLPFRLSSTHFCCDDHNQYAFLSTAVKLFFANRFWARFKVHHGSHMECQYQLNGYGIPDGTLPLTSKDHHQPMLDNHLAWYRDCERRSANLISAETTDVLLGQGYNHQEGNLRLHQLMDMLESKYAQASSDARMAVSDFVVCKMKESGSRFLKRNNSSMEWDELGHADARQRVAKAFQNRRRGSKRKKKQLSP